MGAGVAGRAHYYQHVVQTLRADIEAHCLELEVTRSRLLLTRQRMTALQSQRSQLHESVLARLQARLESLPVIEQAKGVIMADTGCSSDEAFDILRRASQRSNVKVRNIAEEIVGRAALRPRRHPEASRPVGANGRNGARSDGHAGARAGWRADDHAGRSPAAS